MADSRVIYYRDRAEQFGELAKVAIRLALDDKYRESMKNVFTDLAVEYAEQAFHYALQYSYCEEL